MKTSTEQRRYTNALTGLAIGDAWGYQVEFKPYAKMPSYPVAAPQKTWIISDDTQMTLALHHGLDTVPDFDDVVDTTDAITEAFLDWQIDPDNYRAPGTTCMGSLRNIRAGAHWFSDNGAIRSAGCGAVMRLLPAAFAPEAYWAGLTALQAVITHKHPGAVVSALITADATRHATSRVGGRHIKYALAAASDIYLGEHPWLHDKYLAEVLSPVTDNVQQYLIAGLNDRLTDALIRADRQYGQYLAQDDQTSFGDPCAQVGAGWDAATATALALLVADMATPGPLTAQAAIAWGATSDGDSDSIAAIAGSIIGAASAQNGYWAHNGVKPVFEPRYKREIKAALVR